VLVTDDEARARLREAQRANADQPSPGVRFRNSPLGRRLASHKAPKENESVDVTTDPRELRDHLLRNRSLADIMSALQLEEDAPRIVQVVPTPVALLPLCTIVPTSSTQIPTVVDDVQVENAAYAPDGQNLPGLDGSSSGKWTVNYLEAVRVGRVIPVPLAVLEDAGQAEAIVDKLITQNWQRAVEMYALVGPGTNANLTGVAETDDVPTIDATSTNLIDPIAQAVEDIQSGGFYGSHVVTANPITLKAIWGQKDLDNNYLRIRSALPTIGAWVPAPSLPVGTAVAGDFSELLVYLQGTFTVSITQGYEDFLSRNMAAVMGVQRAAIWVRNPTAFAIIENL